MGTTTVNIHEAKTHLSRLLVQAEAGEDIVIAKNGHPLVRLVPIPRTTPRRPGRFVGEFRASDAALFDPLPEDELALWMGSASHSRDPLRRTK